MALIIDNAYMPIIIQRREISHIKWFHWPIIGMAIDYAVLGERLRPQSIENGGTVMRGFRHCICKNISSQEYSAIQNNRQLNKIAMKWNINKLSIKKLFNTCAVASTILIISITLLRLSKPTWGQRTYLLARGGAQLIAERQSHRK